jgi:hypothetical protein
MLRSSSDKNKVYERMRVSRYFLLHNFTSRRPFMRKPISLAEIPNKSASPYAPVGGCGKPQSICGKNLA